MGLGSSDLHGSVARSFSLIERETIFSEVCNLIAQGQSLRKICKAARFPSQQTIDEWILGDKGGLMSVEFARAREMAAENRAQEIIDIADDEKLSAESRRVMIDARKWIASRLLPRVYGDKQQVEHSGDVQIIVNQGYAIDPAKS